MSNSKEVATSLRELARVPKYRHMMVKDQGALPGLVFFLENDDAEVTEIALEALQLLSMETKNRPIMYSEFGVVVSLKAIINREDASALAKKTAKEIMTTLSKPERFRQPLFAKQPSTPQGTPRRTAMDAVKKQSNFFRGGSAKKMQSRIIILEVEGLVDLQERKQVEDALLSVRGTISFTFEMQRERVTIRARKDIGPERLCRAIYEKYSHLLPRQVGKDQYGEDQLIDYIGLTGSDEVSAAPEYLEDDDDQDDIVVANPKEAIVTEAMGAQGNWFGGVVGYVRQNLYW